MGLFVKFVYDDDCATITDRNFSEITDWTMIFKKGDYRIWKPKAPEGFGVLGCVASAG